MLLRYETSFIPYSPDDDFDHAPFIEIIKQDPRHRNIAGKGSILAHYKESFPDHHITQTSFCELKKAPLPKPCPLEIKKAAPEDAPRICQLYNEIEEFSQLPSDPEQIKRVLATHSGRIYYTETADGTLCNAVQTTGENSLSAMVVGVATRKSYRHQGLMSGCLSKLCYDLIEKEGKSLCLFYENPEAGKIYHRLGFETIDEWIMLIKPQK